MDTKNDMGTETPDRSRLALLGALSAAAAGGGCATIEGGAQAVGSQAIRRAQERDAARRAAEDPRLRTPGSDGDGGGGGGGGSH
ncbi:hypothetical protein [Salinarimonas rosea]|uniref:hypothetical protein n=1 Tax=Salinarimonas rosea TaxID=552063 RepID=UPI00041B6DD4|nr:hypothetical protein [Salinarimonas rosea]